MQKEAKTAKKNKVTKKQLQKRIHKYLPLYLLAMPGFIYLITINEQI